MFHLKKKFQRVNSGLLSKPKHVVISTLASCQFPSICELSFVRSYLFVESCRGIIGTIAVSKTSQAASN